MSRKVKADLRLPEITIAYIDDLVKLGVYGKGRSGVMRRLIDAGIQEAIEKSVLKSKDIADFFDDQGEDEG